MQSIIDENDIAKKVAEELFEAILQGYQKEYGADESEIDFIRRSYFIEAEYCHETNLTRMKLGKRHTMIDQKTRRKELNIL
jgi:hypothetical protein